MGRNRHHYLVMILPVLVVVLLGRLLPTWTLSRRLPHPTRWSRLAL